METPGVRERLLLAGMEEIERSGLQNFSLRRVAANCALSSAAPYKHFRDKAEFISAIVQYISEKWYARQRMVIARCNGTREQLTQISLEYIRFLVENPHFRAIVMLKPSDLGIENTGLVANLSDCSRRLIDQYCEEVHMSGHTKMIKTFIVRSIIYGAALMFDNGELEFSEENFQYIAKTIDREFDLS